MKKFFLATVLCSSAALLHADFTYQETTQMTGGSMMTMLRALGPLTRGAREPIVSTHIVKGNRMATITKDRTSIIDLDKETITTIDNAKKTYSVMTFAEMKQALEEAAKRMEGRQKNDKGENVQAQFKVSAKATGQTKIVQGLNAKEMLITMAMEGKNLDTGDSGAMEISTDAWYAPVPGYNEVKEFQKKMAVKLGNMFGSGMQQIAQMAAVQGRQAGQGNMTQGMEQVAKELSKIDGVPVESLVKMGASGTTTGKGSSSEQSQAPPQQEEKQQSGASAIAGAALGHFGGFGRHKKEEPKDEPQAKKNGQQSASSTLMEMTMTLTSFSSGPADASKFEVPAGYKQVEPDMRRAGAGR
jgi:hypothetical protein